MSSAKKRARKSSSSDEEVTVEAVTVDQIRDLLQILRQQKAQIAQLEERVRLREEESMSRAQAARAARIGRAASRAGMTVEAWMKYCERVGHNDPTVLDDKTKKRLDSES